MNFDSVFFLGIFLPLVILLYALIRSEPWRNRLLLAAGLVFYAFGSLQGLALLLLWATVNFLLGLLLQKRIRLKLVCVIGVAGNLLFLGVYKYLNFLLGGLLGLPQLRLDLVVPIGISFFTFKCISYLVDTYRDGDKGTRNYGHFLLYVSFFPQITSGPITRFEDFKTCGRSGGLAPEGLRRFVIGLSKKLLLAATLGNVTDTVFALAAPDARLAWLGAIAYSLQIYFDFSGYSDMAIGLARIFGFETKENFRYPYIADSLTDFWRRWHISLSSWFRDCLYIPLGGNRKGKLRTGLNKAIVFTLCGLWHGANWTFLLWGIWHGLFSALESGMKNKPKKLPGRVYTLLIVCIGFVMFRSASVEQGITMLSAMVTGWTFLPANTQVLQTLWNPETVTVMALSILACYPWKQHWNDRLAKVTDAASYPICLCLFVLCIIRLASGGFSPFIYAQF